MAAGTQCLSWVEVCSATSQPPSNTSAIKTNGRACSPCAPTMYIITAKPSVIGTARSEIFMFGKRRKASTAQRAMPTCRRGSQRKLQRKTPALGSIAITATATMRTSSHLSFAQIRFGSRIRPTNSTTGATEPHESSVAPCGMSRVEKSYRSTVQFGKISAGQAASGTRHCRCAAGSCASRAEPRT